MKKLISFFLIASIFVACSTNRVTGRKQLSLVPESQLQLMASQQYDSFLKENKVVSPAQSQDAAMVQRVGKNIASAITNYYNSQGKGDLLKGYSWEFNLVDSKDINAWAMPGGKTVVYTGLLPVTQTEDALAVVLGHEIAHAIAQHGNERMSQQLVQQLGGVALQVALANKPQQTQDIFLTSYGVGTTVGALLPFSRKEELEADKFGLFFSAMAGYDPRVAIPFWQRMANSGGSKPPELLSTHPADETRIKKLQAIMPDAIAYYNASNKNSAGSGTNTAGSGTAKTGKTGTANPKVKRIKL
ncbi:MAG: M48 family metallopeptidase [Chloroflexota bacterium]|nr:M48 family metallopeptidase [Lentimicrobium sp.]